MRREKKQALHRFILLFLPLIFISTALLIRTVRVSAETGDVSVQEDSSSLKTTSAGSEDAGNTGNTDDPGNAEDPKETAENAVRCVFIGDSYGQGYMLNEGEKSWIPLLAEKMELAPDSYLSECHGGIGFVREKNGFRLINYLEKSLQDVQEKHSDPSGVTELVVGAGYNDRAVSEEQVSDAIGEFVSRAKQIYPNARICLGMIGWNQDSASDQEKLRVMAECFRSSAERYGAVYLNNSEYALRDKEDVFSSDQYHPNQKGQIEIADYLYRALHAVQTGEQNLTIHFHRNSDSSDQSVNDKTVADANIGSRVFSQKEAGLDGQGTVLIGWSRERSRKTVDIRADAVLTKEQLERNIPDMDLYAVWSKLFPSDYTGFQSIGGTQYFYRNGKYAPDFTGLAWIPEEQHWCCIENGVLNTEKNGLFCWQGTWYYLEHGRTTEKTTTLAQVNSRGTWYYVKNSRIDRSFTGVTKFGGTWYAIRNGKLDWNYTGLIRHTSGTWYYIRNGRIDWGFTGLTSRDGVWYYVRGGRLDWNYTGLVRHTNGTWYYIQHGRIYWGTDLLTQLKKGGTWYCVRNSRIDWNYTGLAKHGNRWYYIEKGRLNWKYNGYAQVNGRGRRYRVRGGIAAV